MSEDNLIWLLKWYNSQCNGDWEHGNGVQIETFDNPGWSLRIRLEETELQDRQYQELSIDRSEHDWIRCYIEDKVFNGVGGPLNLPETLQIFRDWVKSCQLEK